MNSIYQGKSELARQMSISFTSQQSLNLYTRKKEVLRIDRENKRLVDKLQHIKAPITDLRH